MSGDWPWPPPVDRGGARHLTRGLAVPDVALPSTAGGTVSLARVPGRAVVFAYTWTGRPGVANPPDWDTIPGAHGSTPEAEGFRNLHSAFRSVGCEVYALSTQPTDWQGELASRIGAQFAFLSDARLDLARALRLPTFTTGGATYLERLTLVILDGRLHRLFYPVHPPDTHARAVLAWVTADVGYAVEGARAPKKP